MWAPNNFLRFKGILRDKVLTGPEIIHFHINNYCNLNCRYCWFYKSSAKGRPKPKKMEFRLFKRIIDEAGEMGTKLVRISGDGEPTLHPKIKDMVHYIKGKGLELAVLTNCAFERDVMKCLTISDKIYVNFSSPLKEVYNELQSPGSKETFKTVIKNLHYLSNSGKGKIQVEYILNKKNYKYVYEMMVLASKLGIESVNFKIMDVVPSNKDLTLSKNDIRDFRKILRFAIKEEPQLRTKSNIASIYEIYSNQSFLKGKQRRWKYSGNLGCTKSCFMGWYFANINLNGDVTPCCRNGYVVGNVCKKSFKDIWHSKEFQRFRMAGKYQFGINKKTWSDCRLCTWSGLNNTIYEKMKGGG